VIEGRRLEKEIQQYEKYEEIGKARESESRKGRRRGRGGG
jgi:hypothetical protein